MSPGDAPSDHLHVTHWRAGAGGDLPVLAVHGVTAHSLSWAWLAAALPDREVLAPDLRGRAGSCRLPGPWGMARHADDVVRALDAAGHERAVVVGHSMGAFVSLVLAHRHPERVDRLVLVDGGPPLPLPEGIGAEQAAELLIGPSLRRLEMRFDSPEAYHDLWRAHPALGPEWGPLLAAYADADLVGSAPELAPSTSREAVDADTRDLLLGDAVRDAHVVLGPDAAPVAGPITLLRAPEGMAPGTPALYDDASLEPWPALEVTTVPGTNHYTIVMSDHGAAAVAAAVTGPAV